MVGGPDYARWLALAVSPAKPASLAPGPPASGGEQISIRLRPDRLRLLEALAARSGWNRNQIIEGLLESGLAVFFHHADDAAAEGLLEAAMPPSLKTNRGR